MFPSWGDAMTDRGLAEKIMIVYVRVYTLFSRLFRLVMSSRGMLIMIYVNASCMEVPVSDV